jgi:nitrate/nitrite-specific signal transduction histidine kinase
MSANELAEALALLADDVDDRDGAALHIDIRIAEIPRHTALVMYVIARKAIEGALSRRPSNVWVSSHDADGDHILVIRDDGGGFEPDHWSVAADMELLLLKERAKSAFGSCSIGSSPGGETTVIVRVPIWADATRERDH